MVEIIDNIVQIIGMLLFFLTIVGVGYVLMMFPLTIALAIVKFLERKYPWAIFFAVTAVLTMGVVFTGILPQGPGDGSGIEWEYVLPVHIIAWWGVWFKDWSKQRSSNWSVAAIPAFIVSVVAGFLTCPWHTVTMLALIGGIMYVKLKSINTTKLLCDFFHSAKLVGILIVVVFYNLWLELMDWISNRRSLNRFGVGL